MTEKKNVNSNKPNLEKIRTKVVQDPSEERCWGKTYHQRHGRVMEQISDANVSPTGNLSIGAVAKLTGISVHTLRAWEKRHSVVEVRRSETGRRLYRKDDVLRLRLLRRLTQSGHSIGNIADLSNDELEEMLALDSNQPPEAAESGTKQCDVCLFSDGSLDDFRLNDRVAQRVNLVAKTREMGELRETIDGKKTLNVVVIFGSIAIHQLRMLRQLKQSDTRHKYFVVFSSAQRDMLDELNALGFTLVRAPITFDQLMEKVIEADEAASSSNNQMVIQEEVPPHKFTRKQLEVLGNYPSAIDCECPHHIANLIRTLTKFESYCQNCASKNADDAYLHNEIYKHTAQARGLMERAITLVIEAENINLNSRAAE